MNGSSRLMPAGGRSTPAAIGRCLLQGILLTVVTLMVFAGAAGWVFDYHYSLPALLVDGMLLLPLFMVLGLVARWRWTLIGTAVGIGFVGLLAHAIKSDQLGVPLMASDLGSLWQLLNILPGWRRLLAWSGIFLVVVLVLSPLWPRRGSAPWLAAVPLILLGWTWTAPLLERAGLLDAEDPREVGGIAYLAAELRGGRDAGQAGPSREEVMAALDGLPAARPSDTLVPRRNVYMVLLETLWDPMQLSGYHFSRDPWDPRFRRLWDMGGRSHILSPSFGGATANAEFEALCGMPASSSRVVFEESMTRPMYCLPRVLREAGYTTMASHPYKSNFWNRETAYRHAGFASYYPIDAYQLDDMDGMFLSDQSSYRQLLERQRMASAPLFSYVVSLSSHYPFQRNGNARPDQVEVTPDEGLLGAYANTIAWSTQAFMDYVEQVLVDDPSALIVAFGDHAPVLGSQPNPYVRAGLRGGSNGDDLAALSSAPLLVIDGDNGPVDLGDIALYELPNAMLGLLQPGVRLHAGVFDIGTRKGRTFLGRLLHHVDAAGNRDKPGLWQSCRKGDGECQDSRQAMQLMRVVRKDLAQGRGHALQRLGLAAPAPSPMEINRPLPPCALAVEAWGPTGAVRGQPFNPQPNGRSAFWFKVKEARGDLKLEVGGEVTDVTVFGKSASASFQAPDFLDKPGRYPLRAFCAGEPAWEIGQFEVSAPAGQAAIVPTAAECMITVKDWGPRHTQQGQAFNPQQDGSSAFWLVLDAGTGRPVLNIDGHQAELVMSGKFASATFAAPAFIEAPGSHSVSVQCPGQQGTELGSFTVHP